VEALSGMLELIFGLAVFCATWHILIGSENTK
jgi:hypothetical protein